MSTQGRSYLPTVLDNPPRQGTHIKNEKQNHPTVNVLTRMLWMHHLLIFGLTITLTLFTSCACNDSSSGHPAEKRAEEIDLQSLTDGELEQICTSRGFELVKDTDKETGQSKQYSHNDYIDAAKQCLEIEAEM